MRKIGKNRRSLNLLMGTSVDRAKKGHTTIDPSKNSRLEMLQSFFVSPCNFLSDKRNIRETRLACLSKNTQGQKKKKEYP